MSIIIPEYSKISDGLYISDNIFRLKDESSFLVDTKTSIGLHRFKAANYEQIINKIHSSALNQLNGNLSKTPDELESMMSSELDNEFLAEIIEKKFDKKIKELYRLDFENNIIIPNNDYFYMQLGVFNSKEQNQYTNPFFPPESYIQKWEMQILLEDENLPNKKRLEALVDEKVSKCPLFNCSSKSYPTLEIKTYLEMIYQNVNIPYHLVDFSEEIMAIECCLLLEDILNVEIQNQEMSDNAFTDLQTYMELGRPLQ